MSSLENSKLFSKHFFQESINSIQILNFDTISEVSVLLFEAKEKGKNIFVFGNGGSHSIASHIACDLGKGTKINGKRDQKYYKIFGLDNPAWLTAQANDGKEPFIEGKYPGI